MTDYHHAMAPRLPKLPAVVVPKFAMTYELASVTVQHFEIDAARGSWMDAMSADGQRPYPLDDLLDRIGDLCD